MNRLVGEQSILWESNPEVALTLWVSMPSPLKEIDVYRNTLIDMLYLKPPSFCIASTLTIVPLCGFSTPLPIGAIYVGSGNEEFPLKPSIWFVCSYEGVPFKRLP